MLASAATLVVCFGDCARAADQDGDNLATIGAIEIINVGIPDSNERPNRTRDALPVRARVDTGAATCSLHAVDVNLPAPCNLKDHIGDTIRFTTKNEDGQTDLIVTKVDKVAKVNGELRYVVKLTLQFDGSAREVDVNLNNRSKKKNMLLLGRNWLLGHYVVDVRRNADLDRE